MKKQLHKLWLPFIGWLCCLNFLIATSASAQQKNVPLKEALNTITNILGTKLVFDPKLIAGKTASLNIEEIKTKPIDEVLKAVLYPNNLLFLYVGKNHYAVVPNLEAGLRSDPESIATDRSTGLRTISGIVTGANGAPMLGVTVSAENSRTGTLTSSDGRYSIRVSLQTQSLTFSYIGAVTQKVELGDDNVINIILSDSNNTLKEVQIVSNGYNSTPKERATGAFNIVSSKVLAETPTINIMERLEGKVPGVKIDLKSNKITIRSLNTFSNTSDPLIVVDGFPLSDNGTDNQKLTNIRNSTATGNSALSNFNPEDIDQITVLKDAAASSIWGSRGANGVIVITTKKGRKNSPVLNFFSTIGISRAPSIASLDMMNSAQFVDLEQELVDKNLTTSVVNSLNAANPSEAAEIMLQYKRGTITLTQRDAKLAEISSRSNQSQIEDLLLQHAVTQQYGLSTSGGGENSTYYLSGNYNKDQSIYRGNSGQNAFLTANLTNDFFNKKVTLRTGFNYQYLVSNVNQSPIDALGLTSTSLRPYDMLLDDNGNRIQRTISFRPEVAATYVARGYLPFGYNALDELDNNSNVNKMGQLRFNMGVNTKVADWLNVDVSGMVQTFNNTTKAINGANSYTARNTVNIATSGAAGALVYGIPNGAIYNQTDGNGYDYNLRGQVNIDKVFNNVHQFTAIAGTEIREVYSKSYGFTQYGFNEDTNVGGSILAPYTVIYGFTNPIPTLSSQVNEQIKRYLSYYGNAGYTYNNKYSVTASIRFDDATLFGVERNKRARPFWSAGLKWNAKQEDFMQGISSVSQLDLRMTYGTGGAIPLGGSNVALLTSGVNDPYTQQQVLTILRAANENLGWETTKTLNAGLDLSMFSGNLSLNFDIYTKKSDGILWELPYNATYGVSSLQFNTGKMESHGLEFGLIGKPLNTKDWGITSIFNFAYNANKVTDNRFSNNVYTNVIGTTVPLNDYALGALFVYKFAGLDPATGQSQIYDRNNNVIKASVNLPTTFTTEDLTYAGVRNAPYYGGFFNNFRYKQFEVGVQISYYLGHVFLRNSVTTANYPSTTRAFTAQLGRNEDIANRWRKPGDEAFTNVPGITGVSANSINRYRYSDVLVESADNIRLQQISLSYRVPVKFLPRNSFKSLSFSANARNLGLIWTKNKEGIDPEYINTTSFSNLPPTPNFIFSLNASF